MDKENNFDDKFIRKLKRGDVMSFHQLYNAFAPSMKLVCMRYVKSQADAEDVFQEGFIKIFSNIHQLNNASSFVGWMKRIFINSSIDYLKQKNKNFAYSFDDTESNHLSEQTAENEDEDWDEIEVKSDKISYDIIKKVDFTESDLLDALGNIPDIFKTVFQLHVVDKLKHQEIGQMLGINEKTSKTRLLRARRLLKIELQKMALEKLTNG